MNLTEFEYRAETVPLKDIFPRFDIGSFKGRYGGRLSKNPHEEILQVTRQLWNRGYNEGLDEYGFHDPDYVRFSGHCHQITPFLGAVLLAKGFKVAYMKLTF